MVNVLNPTELCTLKRLKWGWARGRVVRFCWFGSWVQTRHRLSGHVKAVSHMPQLEGPTSKIYNYVRGRFGEKKQEKNIYWQQLLAQVPIFKKRKMQLPYLHPHPCSLSSLPPSVFFLRWYYYLIYLYMLLIIWLPSLSWCRDFCLFSMLRAVSGL